MEKTAPPYEYGQQQNYQTEYSQQGGPPPPAYSPPGFQPPPPQPQQPPTVINYNTSKFIPTPLYIEGAK